jgi:hypothetical protein
VLKQNKVKATLRNSCFYIDENTIEHESVFFGLRLKIGLAMINNSLHTGYAILFFFHFIGVLLSNLYVNIAVSDHIINREHYPEYVTKISKKRIKYSK